MRIWFRHSGQPPTNWSHILKAHTTMYTTDEVEREVGSHDITYVKLKEKIPSNIGVIAGKALWLWVSKLTEKTSLQK